MLKLNKPKTRGFSLVELVIVVVIIGVIAAIAVPRISRGAKGAGESALRGSLAALRNAIDMYAAEHNGAWPGADDSETTLIDQLTKNTNAGGAVGTGVNYPFGPYLRRGFPPIPVGPNASKATGVIMADNTSYPTAVDDSSATDGWVYNNESGEIKANTDDTDEASVGYDTY